MEYIAHIRTDFPTKFGIPRQSGIVEELKGRIVFEPHYRQAEALRGLEAFTHIWILWDFSVNHRSHWSATVKPPRLGGNKRMGVFATRSPFRPNNIGLSCVRLEHIIWESEEGPILEVAGVDMMDNTPVYDIKPYIPYTDCRMEASGGFAEAVQDYSLKVIFPEELLKYIPEEKRKAAIYILEQDPRPAYQSDETRRYGVEFAGFDLRFRVKDSVLTVCEIEDLNTGEIFENGIYN